MRNYIVLWLLLIVNETSFWLVNSQRVKDNMYQSIKGASCFKRLNGTHVTGCTSTMRGSVGVIHLIKSIEDIDFIVNVHPSPPYAAVIPPNLFTRDNILRLKNDAAAHISVIVLINNATSLTTFSQESKCPNQFGGLVSKQTCDPLKPQNSWNPFGTGLLLEDFPFPIYYVADEEEILKIYDCFEKFNNFDLKNQNKRSLCSIQVNSFMSAAVNSEVCTRRTNFLNNLNPTRFCDPLQGKNVYATLYPREHVEIEKRKADSKERVILVTTRMDTTTMFDGVGVGAFDSLVPFATLVSIAHYLAKLLPERMNSDDLNVLFVLFNGESYDYIGSQRFVYDLQKENFPTKSTHTNPLTIGNIELMIDLGTLDDANNLKIYHATDMSSANKITEIMNKVNNKFDLNVKSMDVLSESLPPVSAQSFLRENITFNALIVTSEPKNKYYHSIYDDAENLNYQYGNLSQTIDFTALEELGNSKGYFAAGSIQAKIRNVSNVLGMSIYELVTKQAYTGTMGSSSALIDEFLFCYLVSADCPLFRAASKPDSPKSYAFPPQRYISVHSSYTQEATYWANRILAFLVGQKVEKMDKETCRNNPYYWFAGYSGHGECRLTTQNYTLAISPAFTEENYDWKSGKYSTWTESTWRELSARIFVTPSTAQETLTLSIGFVVMVISFVLVFLINSRSEVLFNQSASTIPIATPTQC